MNGYEWDLNGIRASKYCSKQTWSLFSRRFHVLLSGNQTLKNETYPGWWCNNHLETYEFVNFGRIIPYMKWKIKFHGSNPPISIEFESIWKDNPLYWGIHCEELESVNGLWPGQGDTDRSWQENHCVCVHQGWNFPSHPAPSKTLSGWWLTYPSEKWWSSSVGMMTFPTEWKVIKFHGSSHHQPDILLFQLLTIINHY